MKRKIVFILGAGASKQGGAPVMRDFLDEAFRLWKEDRVQDEEAFEAVFEARSILQQVFSKSYLDIHNIETVFAAFDMAKVLGGFGSYGEEEIDQLINSMRSLIVETIESTLAYGPQTPGPSPPDPPKPYGPFVKLLEEVKKRFSVSIITFNYDLGIDYAIKWLWYNSGKLETDYGLGEFRGTLPTQIPVLKLHGSLNWRTCKNKDCRAICAFPIDDNTVGHCFVAAPPTTNSSFLRSGRVYQEAKCKTCNSDLADHPVVVPPTWNKTGYHQELSSVWSRAASELKQAEQIVISGYSLPESDYFFRYLYALGTVGSEVLLRFLVFDPDETGTVRDRYMKILGGALRDRFKLISLTFEEGISYMEERLVGPSSGSARSIYW